MACTRFYYDDCRTIKRLQQSTDPGKWILNVPGNGPTPDYMADPHIRPQKWVGNLMTNTVQLENSLRGMNRPLTRDCVKDTYTNYSVPTSRLECPTNTTMYTEQSRTTNPAWWYRDLEQVDWYILPLNPQENTCRPFESNLSTRILEKDYFTPKRECVIQQTNANLPPSYSIINGTAPNYVGGPTLCASTNTCQYL